MLRSILPIIPYGTPKPFYEGQGTPRSPTAPSRTLPSTILRLIVVHTYYKGDARSRRISMFSYEDLQIFTGDALVVNARGKDTSKMTSILVASDGDTWNVYAIKKDPDSDIVNNYSNHQIATLGMSQAQIKDEKDDYKVDIGRAKNQDALEIIALKQFKKMGLQLFKTKDVHTGWEQLTLDPNSSDPKKPKLGTPEPCN